MKIKAKMKTNNEREREKITHRIKWHTHISISDFLRCTLYTPLIEQLANIFQFETMPNGKMQRNE